jgi:hypothetical protein
MSEIDLYIIGLDQVAAIAEYGRSGSFWRAMAAVRG